MPESNTAEKLPQEVVIRLVDRYPDLAKRMDKFDEKADAPGYMTHLDGWMNGLTGIGTSRDKVTSTAFQAVNGCLLPSELEALYHNDDVAARICDLLPKTALRKGWTVSDDRIQKEMNRLGVTKKFREAAAFGRLYGGCPILLGGPGDPQQPIEGGNVRSMYVMDRWALYPYKFYTDTNDEKYGTPELYRITRPNLIGMAAFDPSALPPVGELVHESRVIIFGGALTSPRRKLANGYWDDSVLQRVYQVVQAYGLTWASVIHLLQDAAQGVYKMKDLWNMIVGGHKQAVQDRMATVDEQRSSARAILVDAEHEDFTRVPTPFTGIPELIDRISERLASASEYPLTVLMGSSPAGMNATGQSDLELFYGKCEDWRNESNTPNVQKLATALGAKEDLKVEYQPLWLPSAEEQAKTRYATAQTDQIYKNMGTPSKLILTSRFRPSGWSPDMVVDENTKLDEPPPLGAPGTPAGAREGEGAGTNIGTHHFSPKYGR